MWDPAPGELSLGETELHVWRIRRYIAAHGALRRILSRYCGIAPSRLLTWEYAD